ncbi:MAG TPA: acyl-CoA dehydrogenase family protein [Acidimicrobiales bacterium]|nr:acyl-CoA dehydrogenase family protein [Acidimicrobiales bacterium]
MSLLEQAAAAVAAGQSIVDSAIQKLGDAGGPDVAQLLAYDVAHASAGLECARAGLEYAAHGEAEHAAGVLFASEALVDLTTRIAGRDAEWGDPTEPWNDIKAFLTSSRDPAWAAAQADAIISAPRHLDDDFQMVAESFGRFASDRIAPAAEHVHRTNGDIPEEVLSGLAELGGFGLSVPEEYGGFATGGESDYMGMVVATEELSRASLGVGGSLITRPEILTRALVKGGTEEQRKSWLPRLASGETLVAVAVTEPDHGSDVANLTVSAVEADGGWRINGVKTWCTFAGRANVLMLLARTNPDRAETHRGLSLFIVPKPVGEGDGFEFTDDHGGKMEGRAIDTIGYRGMHSYEVALDGWWVPEDHLVGGREGLGRGFYLTMEGFENGRLQTAARAVGVMQAALDAAVAYARERKVFGRAVVDYQLTQVKLARMAAATQVARQSAYRVAKLMAKGEGTLEVAMLKAYVCRAAEWVTREAMQIHGGMGYAEEFPVSRYFVDARVLSIFEGADETLALKLIARKLVA